METQENEITQPRGTVVKPALVATDPSVSAPSRRRRADPPVAGRLLDAQSAARYLGVPYTSFRDWALRGHVPIVRVPECRRLWFDRRDLDRLVEAWKERA